MTGRIFAMPGGGDDERQPPDEPENELVTAAAREVVRIREFLAGYSHFGQLCLRLSGANLAVLADSPSDADRFIRLGRTVLTTAVLAAVSMAYATHSLLHVPVRFAVPAGVGWALAIGNLDAYILATIKRQKRWWHNLLQALPRIGFALVVGLVIALPIDLFIFRNEIAAQAAQDQQHAAAVARRQTYSAYPEIRALTATQQRIEVDLASASPDYRSNSTYAALEASLASEEGKLSAAELQVARECAGVGLGRLPAGCGPVAHSLQLIANQDRSQVASTQAQVVALKSSIDKSWTASWKQARAAEEAQLSSVDAQLATLRAELEQALVVEHAADSAPIGLLGQIEALAILERQRPAVRGVADLLTLFVLGIDSLPVLVKTMALLGGEASTYDKRERIYRRSSTAIYRDLRKAARRMQRARLQLATARVKGEVKVATDFVAQALKAYREKLDGYLQRYAENEEGA